MAYLIGQKFVRQQFITHRNFCLTFCTTISDKIFVGENFFSTKVSLCSRIFVTFVRLICFRRSVCVVVWILHNLYVVVVVVISVLLKYLSGLLRLQKYEHYLYMPCIFLALFGCGIFTYKFEVLNIAHCLF